METIDEFLQQLRQRVGRPLAGSNVNEADLDAAEASLRVRLPASYRRLVATCAPEDLPHWVYWVGPRLPPGLDLLRINQRLPRPRFLIAVSGDGSGDEFCFDTRHPAQSGEFPVVRWDHEIHDEHSSEFERVADDLGAFLLQLL